MGTKILLIDDDVDTRKVLHHTLSKEGYEIILASSGESGVKSAKEKVPDLIVLDIDMPGMDGYQVQEELAKEQNTAKIPIIMLTGQRGSEPMRESLQRGAVDYLSKPADLAKLKTKIRHLLLLKEVNTSEDVKESG